MIFCKWRVAHQRYYRLEGIVSTATMHGWCQLGTPKQVSPVSHIIDNFLTAKANRDRTSDSTFKIKVRLKAMSPC